MVSQDEPSVTILPQPFPSSVPNSGRPRGHYRNLSAGAHPYANSARPAVLNDRSLVVGSGPVQFAVDGPPAPAPVGGGRAAPPGHGHRRTASALPGGAVLLTDGDVPVRIADGSVEVGRFDSNNPRYICCGRKIEQMSLSVCYAEVVISVLLLVILLPITKRYTPQALPPIAIVLSIYVAVKLVIAATAFYGIRTHRYQYLIAYLVFKGLEVGACGIFWFLAFLIMIGTTALDAFLLGTLTGSEKDSGPPGIGETPTELERYDELVEAPGDEFVDMDNLDVKSERLHLTGVATAFFIGLGVVMGFSVFFFIVMVKCYRLARDRTYVEYQRSLLTKCHSLPSAFYQSQQQRRQSDFPVTRSTPDLSDDAGGIQMTIGGLAAGGDGGGRYCEGYDNESQAEDIPLTPSEERNGMPRGAGAGRGGGAVSNNGVRRPSPRSSSRFLKHVASSTPPPRQQNVAQTQTSHPPPPYAPLDITRNALDGYEPLFASSDSRLPPPAPAFIDDAETEDQFLIRKLS